MKVTASCNWNDAPNDPRVFIELDPDTAGAAEHFAAFLADKVPFVMNHAAKDGHVNLEIGFLVPIAPDEVPDPKQLSVEEIVESSGDESQSAT